MELLDVVDENNNLTGKVEDKDFIHKNGIFHREVAIWIMNEKVRYYYKKEHQQKRNILINGG